jgi:hypothetical protein
VRWRGGRDNTLALARCTHRLLKPRRPPWRERDGAPGRQFRQVRRFRRKECRSPDHGSATTSIVPTHLTRDLTRRPAGAAAENRPAGKVGAEQALRHAPRWCAHLTTIHRQIVIVGCGASV